MKAREVVGRTIVGIHQERVWNESTSRFEYSLEAIRLDNGTSILLDAREDDAGSWVFAWVNRR